jgi:ABC-type uncharacterized transport system substrate-binding protein
MRDRTEAISATARIHHTSCRRCPYWTADGYRSDTQGLPPRYADRGSADKSRDDAAVLIGALTQRGYTLGQNLTYEARGAAGKLSQMPQQMQELKTANVGVVVTVSYPAAVIAKSSGIPTVIATGSGDPVAAGLVASLARPGGNVTGLSDVATTLSTKRLSLLKEMLPQLRRVAMLWNKGDRGMSLRYEASAVAARELGVIVQPLGVASRTISSRLLIRWIASGPTPS